MAANEKDKEKDPALVRQWILLQMLSHRSGVTLQEMAREAGVVERTIQRDLRNLAAMGFPIEPCRTSEHGAKYWRMDPKTKGLLPLELTFDEAMALFMGRRLLDPLAGTLIGQSINSALRKIHASLSDRARWYLNKMGGTFHATRFGASDYHEKSEIIDALMIGIEDREVINLTYQSLRATEPVTYDVSPFGMIYHHNSLYLVARSDGHDEQLRMFKIDRIANAQQTGLRKFNKPNDFELRRQMADSFGVFLGTGPPQTVRVRFAAEVARVVSEGCWHASQKLSSQDDGTLIAEFQLNDLHEITSWILSFGAKATVLDPPHLRATIAQEHTQALREMEHSQ